MRNPILNSQFSILNFYGKGSLSAPNHAVAALGTIWCNRKYLHDTHHIASAVWSRAFLFQAMATGPQYLSCQWDGCPTCRPSKG